MQLRHFGGVDGSWNGAVMALHERLPRQFCSHEPRPNQISRRSLERGRFARSGWIWARRSVIGTGFGLVMLCAAVSPAQAQSHAGVCLPMMPPELPSDAGLMREFAVLLREEFEHYLAEVSAYFRCLDDERARAWREAAEVTAQYGAFLEALRRAPP